MDGAPTTPEDCYIKNLIYLDRNVLSFCEMYTFFLLLCFVKISHHEMINTSTSLICIPPPPFSNEGMQTLPILHLLIKIKFAPQVARLKQQKQLQKWSAGLQNGKMRCFAKEKKAGLVLISEIAFRANSKILKKVQHKKTKRRDHHKQLFL